MGETIVTIIDRNNTEPHAGVQTLSFNVYNDAMSYAKNASIEYWSFSSAEKLIIYVWNYNGGSGYWNNGTYNDQSNNNYPA